MKTKIKNTLLIILNILILFAVTSPFIISYAEGNDSGEDTSSDTVEYSLSIKGANTVEEGKTLQLDAYLTTQNNNTPDNPDGSSTTKIESGCIWSSNNEDVATVSNTGLVTAKVSGTITITAKHKTNSQDLSATHQITVTASSGGTTPDPNPPAESNWSDVSNASFKIIKENNFYYISISGIQYINNHTYYFMLSNSSARPAEDKSKSVSVNTDKNRSDSINPYFELNGDIYVWFYERYYSNGEQIKEHISAIKLDRPALNPVGSRMHAYFFNEYTSTYLDDFFSSSSSRALKIKIGHVNDINILKNIRDKKSNCLVDLLNYAKNADAIYVAQIPLGRSNTITNNFNIKDKEYFYVYMELDDENGKYYPVEDISLYQGCVSETIGKNLFDYLSGDFKWQLEEGGSSSGEPNPETPSGAVNPTDPTQATTVLPNTGTELLISVMVLITIIATGSYFIYKKYKDV